MPGSKLRTVVKANTLKAIPYYDKPPVQGGKLTYLTPEEFKLKFGCIYSESILVDATAPALQLTQKQHTPPSHRILTKILERLVNPRDDIAICYINEKIGHALIALKDIPLNPEDNEVLFLYAGVIEPAGTFDTKHDDYAKRYEAEFKGVETNPLTVTSREIGGLGRFMPHLPHSKKRDEAHLREQFSTPEKMCRMLREYGAPVDLAMINNIFSKELIDEVAADSRQSRKDQEDEFSSYQFVTPEIETMVATANCCVGEYVINGQLVSVAILEHPLKRGQIIGFSYDRSYWETCRQTPELLTRYGQVVRHESYKWQYPSIPYTIHNKYLCIRQSTSELLEQHIKRDLPIDTHEGVLSVYSLRDKLVAANALPQSYGALPEKSSFITRLEYVLNKLEQALTPAITTCSTSHSLPSCSSDPVPSETSSKEYSMSSYFSAPWLLYDRHVGCESISVNTVIQAHSHTKQQQIWSFFQQQTFAPRCKMVSETKEIIIQDTNDGSSEIQHWDLGLRG